MASLQTKTGTRKLSEVARKIVAPSGITSTGWPGVHGTCQRKLGISFDDWQDSAGRLILAKRADGKLAAMIGGVGISVARQVGKTYLIGGMTFGLCVNQPKMLVIWSAHHARTHGETFLAMQEFAKRSKVRPYIQAIYVGSGDEEIRFRNGSRILFGARERGFGRGIPGVDMIVSDEAQIMSEKALDAQLATMNTSRFGLAIFVGTPPRPDDPSEAFTRMRTEAWDGSMLDSVWIEIGADPDASPNDRHQWLKANPSFPHRTPVESILRLQRKLSHESFLREGLGIWDSDMSGWIIPKATWDKQRRWDDEAGKPTSRIKGQPVFAIDVSKSRGHAYIAAAGVASAGGFQFELVDHRPGTAWVVAAAKRLAKKHRADLFIVDAASEAAGLVPDLEEAGLRVVKTESRQMVQACGYWFDDVTEGRVVHLGQEEVDTALAGAAWRELEASRALGRKKSTVDIAPLVACVLALWGQHEHGDYNVADSFW